MIKKIFSIKKENGTIILNLFGKNIIKIPTNNKIVIVENGKERRLRPFEKISGLSFDIKGSNNTIVLEKPLKFTPKFPSVLHVHTNNNEIIFKKSKYVIFVEVYCQHGDNQRLFIDEDFSSGGALLCLFEENCSIEIGKDCQFSSDISILNSDGHCIFDKDTKELINLAKGVKIGNHVWLGRHTLLSKNASIPDNCIVGFGSVVTKSFTEQNCVLSGNPAEIRKRNIEWERTAVSEIIRKNPTKLNEIMKGNYV